MKKQQKPTGERLLPDEFGEDTISHFHRYAMALEYVQNKDVLDIACGEGYGSFIMSKVSKSVVGVDINEAVIHNASNKYKNSVLSFKQGNATAIPLASSSVDIVVSFETIEHIKEQDEMLWEIKRVLRPNGLLIMSSPDKKTYSDDRNFTNKYHVKELYYEEFILLIRKHFKFHQELFQKYFYGSVILSKNNVEKEYSGNYTEIKSSDVFSGMRFNIVIASDMEIEKNVSGAFFRDHVYMKKDIMKFEIQRHTKQEH